ncbi:MAG: ADP-ribosylglycohydrolase family protein [Planctomycetales bacterium]|nr:ADP-ribosylglycohydrolase family protein [Planctomycetales bacterium]
MGETHVIGCILGVAVGDAIGLPYEGLTSRRARLILGEPDRHRFLLGRGMFSDDTEHTCFVAQSLLSSRGDGERFARSLGWKLRLWLLGVPAGVGFATLRATLRLWLGFSPRRSGVRSAGNGPAMRSAVIGAVAANRQDLRELVRASTVITHTDPRAEQAAFAVALAAHLARDGDRVPPNEYVFELSASFDDEAEELIELVSRAAASAGKGEPTKEFSQSLASTDRVSRYCLHCVAVALHAWFRYPGDFRTAVIEVIRCGGDTDTTAAIAGGIIGCEVGQEGIPVDWLDGIHDWPRSVSWLCRLGSRLHHSMEGPVAGRPMPLHSWALPFRNLLFLLTVLFHGFRRLLPPY